MTVVPLLNSQKPEERYLQALFTEWAATNDVFRPEFLNGVVFVSTIDQEAHSYQMPNTLRQTWGTDFCVTLSMNVPERGPPTGPHLLEDGKLFTVYRLYDDINRAFMAAVKPSIGSGFEHHHVGRDSIANSFQDDIKTFV